VREIPERALAAYVTFMIVCPHCRAAKRESCTPEANHLARYRRACARGLIKESQMPNTWHALPGSDGMRLVRHPVESDG
jgi:hypothetical protein